ncbi:MAG: HD domain-containing protein [Deltaproteobacteria bacterium]|nr:HD domain-containing protein [Deltaproteobacteria bacterium]
MRKNWVTIALTAGALLAVLFFVFHLHQTSKEKVLSQFNENQLLTAQQFARPIERYFYSRSQDLRWLVYIASQQALDRDKIAAAIRANFNRLKMTNIQEVSLLDEKGTVVYSTTAGAKGKNHSQADFFSWAGNPGNKGKVRMWYEKTQGPRIPMTAGSPAPPHIGIFLVTPLYRESAAGGHQRSGKKFAGALLFTVDLEKEIANRLPLPTPATKSHKLWIMERGGTLLVHSVHPEMVMKDIRKRDDTCNGCHTSFDYLETILGKAEGTIEYQIKGEHRTVAAFTSMTFENTSWIIVMNTPLDEVTDFGAEHLRETLFLLGSVVLLLGIAFFSTYRNYRRKVAGEMEVKRLQGNQVLLEKLRKTLGGTIQVISRTVEMRDPYTAGHQRRAADLARAIATEMGISADRTDFVRIAGTIHDIGKISVPAEILSKPTKLTDIEFRLIKAHAQAGYDILKNIEFPWPVADVILQHHERMDGSGYPQGIKGDDILLESRILAVADVVESMASHRPYRPALGIDAALEEITKNRGTLYDPRVVDICLRLFNEKSYKMVD